MDELIIFNRRMKRIRIGLLFLLLVSNALFIRIWTLSEIIGTQLVAS